MTWITVLPKGIGVTAEAPPTRLHGYMTGTPPEQAGYFDHCM
ncbi:MAG TPA: hypothetical protein VFX43_19365 [Chitinophagaceae bacterium]|nr:hypothetical protein [Chitinophagaceae bacterium]